LVDQFLNMAGPGEPVNKDKDGRNNLICLQKKALLNIRQMKFKKTTKQEQNHLLSLNPLDNDPFCWAFEIIKFFEIREALHTQKIAALKVTQFFKNCKRILIKHKFKKII
jgi:hypothetical protein